jgi:hypothetical protein
VLEMVSWVLHLIGVIISGAWHGYLVGWERRPLSMLFLTASFVGGVLSGIFWPSSPSPPSSHYDGFSSSGYGNDYYPSCDPGSPSRIRTDWTNPRS